MRAVKVGLVVADDARGGWTDRYCSEFSHRFEGKALDKRGGIVGILWASETPFDGFALALHDAQTKGGLT